MPVSTWTAAGRARSRLRAAALQASISPRLFRTGCNSWARKTSSGPAPWTIIRSNSKRRARLNAMKVILNSIDYADRDQSLDFTPAPKVVISGADELARMDQERDELGHSVY